jgi:hypothetical protein
MAVDGLLRDHPTQMNLDPTWSITFCCVPGGSGTLGPRSLPLCRPPIQHYPSTTVVVQCTCTHPFMYYCYLLAHVTTGKHRICRVPQRRENCTTANCPAKKVPCRALFIARTAENLCRAPRTTYGKKKREQQTARGGGGAAAGAVPSN